MKTFLTQFALLMTIWMSVALMALRMLGVI